MVINLDKLTIAMAAGAAANLAAGGMGSRLAMRAVVLLLGGQPALSLEGTLGILMLAAMLGIPLGVLVAGLHGWAGARWRQADWALGGLLAAAVTALFFVNREGELALLPPWQGALLFAPLALLSTLAAGQVYVWLERRQAGSPPRRAPAAWLGAYGFTFFLALVGMLSLAGGSLRLPRVAWHMASLAAAGADMAAVYAPMQMLGLLFALGWLLLTWLLFWRADSRELRAASIGCLLLAAGLFHTSGALETLLGRGTAAGLLEGGLALIGAVVLAVVYWRLLARPAAQVRRAPLVISLLLLACILAALAALIGVQPQWSIARQPLHVTLFSVTLYLLPWLLLPVGLLLSKRPAPGSQASSSGHASGAVVGAAALADLG